MTMIIMVIMVVMVMAMMIVAMLAFIWRTPRRFLVPRLVELPRAQQVFCFQRFPRFAPSDRLPSQQQAEPSISVPSHTHLQLIRRQVP